MDMMRPVSVALPPIKAGRARLSITGNGNNGSRPDLERQLDHRDVVRGPAIDDDGIDLDRCRDESIAARPAEHPRARAASPTPPTTRARLTCTGSSPRTRSATGGVPEHDGPVGVCDGWS